MLKGEADPQAAKVSATPGVDFGPTGKKHIRLSFCVPESIISKAFDRMEADFIR